MAPECLKINIHDKQADWWSFVVIMYELLTGCLPFEGHTSAEIIRNQRQKLQLPKHLSTEAADLIVRLLKRNPNKRISNNIHNIKSHPFFSSIEWKKVGKREVVSPLKIIDLSSTTSSQSELLKDKRKRREDSSMFSRLTLFSVQKKDFRN